MVRGQAGWDLAGALQDGNVAGHPVGVEGADREAGRRRADVRREQRELGRGGLAGDRGTYLCMIASAAAGSSIAAARPCSSAAANFRTTSGCACA